MSAEQTDDTEEDDATPDTESPAGEQTADAETSETHDQDESETHDQDESETHDGDALAADLRELLGKIEEIHPEPYHGYDGRVDLHATFETAIRNLDGPATTEDAYRLTAELVAGLDDAHSRVVPPEGDGNGETQLPISIRVVGDALYVDAVYDESLADLLGARVRTVEGESIDAMAERYARLRGSENRYFPRMALGDKIESDTWFDRLLDGAPDDGVPTFEFCLTDGTTVQRSVEPIAADREPVSELETAGVAPDGTGPRYTLIDDGQTAVFVPGNLMCYREVVQGALDRDAGYTASIARDAYEEHYDDDPPEAVEEIVPELPSMVETLTELVRAMAAAETESLVVDLRDNPGGDSRFVQYIGYFLYGWETLVEGSDWNIALKRRTDPHRERFGVPDSADDEYATYEDNPAGYDFGTRFRTRETSFEEKLAGQRETLASGAFADELEDETHEGYYAPDQLVVVTTAGTMSSAFAGAALLSEFGADVVGVPSGQAPLSFGEAVEVTLPNTGLTVDIAGSMYRWTRNPSGDVLPMACELTRELFEDRYGRDGDAALQLGLDWARGPDAELTEYSR